MKRFFIALIIIFGGCRKEAPLFSDTAETVSLTIDRSFSPSTSIVFFRNKDGSVGIDANRVPLEITNDEVHPGKPERLVYSKSSGEAYHRLYSEFQNLKLKEIAASYPPSGFDGYTFVFKHKSGALTEIYTFWCPAETQDGEVADYIVRFARKFFEQAGIPLDDELRKSKSRGSLL